MTEPGPDQGDFLGIPLFLGSTDEFISRLVAKATERASSAPLTVAYLNAWTTVLASRDKRFAARLARDIGLVYADGMGVVWAARRLGLNPSERVNAADFIEHFLRAAAQEKLSVYFLGGAEGVASKVAEKWQKQIPELKVAGCDHGYFPDGQAAAERIGKTAADIVIVGLGSPTQENWAVLHGPQTGAKVVWCVGAMMEYHAGHTARAPKWMRRIGLEWLFRLAVEPRRLWYRYLIGNVAFLLLVLHRSKLAGTDEAPP